MKKSYLTYPVVSLTTGQPEAESTSEVLRHEVWAEVHIWLSIFVQWCLLDYPLKVAVKWCLVILQVTQSHSCNFCTFRCALWY